VPEDLNIQRQIDPITRGVRAGLSALYGPRLRGVLLYGSYARGDAREGSDIDFLIVLENMEDTGDELDRMSELGARLSLAHDVTISLIPVDEKEFHERPLSLYESVRREGVPV
jgi:predicted nucleotidyltransferase